MLTVTTLLIDLDFLVDQVFWNHFSEFTDRLQAQEKRSKKYVDVAQVLHLDVDRTGHLSPWLDELVSLSWGDPSYAARVFRRCVGMTPRAYAPCAESGTTSASSRTICAFFAPIQHLPWF